MAGKRILIVDDNTSIASATATMVRMMGHSPVVTWDNESALAMWAETESAFDIAVINHILPDGSGARLATRLMAEKPGMRVILVSGIPEDKADAPHGVRFLVKPFSVDELRRVVEERR